MFKFENVKFNEIKNKMMEGILNDIYNTLIFHKNIFLTDRLHFNGLLDLRTTLSFFSEGQQYFNRYEQIIHKPLTIEDFLYRSLEEILFDCKKCLTLKLNELEEKYNLNFFNLTIIHGTYANFLSRDTYFKHME